MITVQDILDEASQRFGDTSKGKFSDDRLLLLYNETTEFMALTWKILERDSTHDIDANEDRYLYPDDCIEMSRWRYSTTPTDPNSYTKGGEIFEDEWTRATNRSMPLGDSEFRYWARAQFFEITPKPTQTVAEAGLISYWRTPARVLDPRTEFLELPGGLRSFVRRRMVMEMKQDTHRYDEYALDLQVWERDIDRVCIRFEDRSDDRRPRLRLKSRIRGTSGMN